MNIVWKSQFSVVYWWYNNFKIKETMKTLYEATSTAVGGRAGHIKTEDNKVVKEDL